MEIEKGYKIGPFWSNKPAEWFNKKTAIFWRISPSSIIPLLKSVVKPNGESLWSNFGIVGGEEENSKVDIPVVSEKLPILLGRLATVFEIYNRELEEMEEGELYLDQLLQLRIKPTLSAHKTDLEQATAILYLMEQGDRIPVIIGNLPKDELKELLKFLYWMGLEKGKVGVISISPLLPFPTFSDLLF